MKRYVFHFLLAVAMVTVFVTGCATTGRVSKMECDLAEWKGFAKGTQWKVDEIAKDLEATKTDLGAVKTNLGATKNDVVVLKSNLKKVGDKAEADLNEVKEEIQGLAQKSDLDGVKTELMAEVEEQVKKFEDLRGYVLPILKKHEALQGYIAPDAKELQVCFVGSFLSGQSRLDKNGEVSMAKALVMFKGKEYEVVGIHGFGDLVGFKGKTLKESKELNLKLSLSRAKDIQDQLKKAGVDVPDKNVQGLGDKVEFGKEKDNRCVAIFFRLKPPTPPTPPTPPPNPKRVFWGFCSKIPSKRSKRKPKFRADTLVSDPEFLIYNLWKLNFNRTLR